MAREMKERFGEPNADDLRKHLDPVGLNRLLLRDYVNSAELRGLNTSHCWNPLCGRWAYKATSPHVTVRMRRPLGVVYVAEEQDPIIGTGISSPMGERAVAIVGDRNTFLDTDRIRSSITTASETSEAGGSSPSSPSAAQGLAWMEGDIKVDRV